MPDNSQPASAQVMAPRVLALDFRPPAIPQEWNSTDSLIQQYISTMKTVSGGALAYYLTSKLQIRKYPVLVDGRQYDDATWTQAMQDDKSAYRDANGLYVMADYMRIIQDFGLLQQVQNGTLDEVWMFGGPYFGFYESRMVGKGAFWCNAPGIEQNCRRFVMMGYNYQRDVREMVHDFGHRAESILGKQFGSFSYVQQLYAPQPPAAAAMPAPKNDFEQFLQTNGTVHRKPGGADYSQDEIAWATALKPAWFPPVVNPNSVTN